MTEHLAAAGGHSLTAGMSTVGSSTLSYHSRYEPTLNEIYFGNWDLVVLQEHTLFPVIPHWAENSFAPKVAWFDSLITANGGEPVLFMQQAYKDAEGEYCAWDYCSREFEDYNDMQREMSQVYYPLAESLDIQLVPVGDVWAESLGSNSELPLWGNDDLHASAEGSYLSACMFYLYLFDESPVGLSYLGDLDAQTALMYQQYAGRYTKPRNVHPEIIDSQVYLSWEHSLSAEYNVYSSESPYEIFPDEWTLETHLPISDKFWSSAVTYPKRFYRVTAVR
jgi:hypothetical protein